MGRLLVYDHVGAGLRVAAFVVRKAILVLCFIRLDTCSSLLPFDWVDSRERYQSGASRLTPSWLLDCLATRLNRIIIMTCWEHNNGCHNTVVRVLPQLLHEKYLDSPTVLSHIALRGGLTFVVSVSDRCW